MASVSRASPDGGQGTGGWSVSRSVSGPRDPSVRDGRSTPQLVLEASRLRAGSQQTELWPPNTDSCDQKFEGQNWSSAPCDK